MYRFPHTNEYDSDLYFLIEKYKELSTIYKNLSFQVGGYWDISKSYEYLTIVVYDNVVYLSIKPVPQNIIISNEEYWLKVADNSYLNDKITTLHNELNNVSTELNTEKTTRQQDDNLINARIDALSTLQEGSTTGDAELTDARVGYNGVTYTNVGTAIRTQVENLHSDVDNLWRAHTYTTDFGYISVKGNPVSSTSWKNTGFIELKPYSNHLYIPMSEGPASVKCVFYSNANYTNFISTYTGESNIVDVPNNAKYVIVNFYKGNETNFSVNYSLNDIIKNRKNNFIDIRDYGVTSGEDITTKLQQAVNDATTLKVPLYIPNNNYIVSSTISLNDNMVILGSNGLSPYNATSDITAIKEYTISYNGSGELFKKGDGKLVGCTFKDLILVSSTKSNMAIRVNGYKNTISNCTIGGFNVGLMINNNIDTSYVGRLIVSDCYFTNNNTDIRGAQVSGGSVMTDWEVVNCVFASSGYSLNVDFIASLKFINNHDWSQYGIRNAYNTNLLVCMSNIFDHDANTSLQLGLKGKGNIIANNVFLNSGDNSEFDCIKITSASGTEAFVNISNNVVTSVNGVKENATFIHTTGSSTDYHLTLLNNYNNYSDFAKGVVISNADLVTLKENLI